MTQRRDTIPRLSACSSKFLKLVLLKRGPSQARLGDVTIPEHLCIFVERGVGTRPDFISVVGRIPLPFVCKT